MIKPQATVQDPDTTLIRPLFDEAATESARPVVPLAADEADADYPAGRRRSWPWALVIASAILGSVLGVLGVGLYQRRRVADVPAATRIEPTPEPPAFSLPSPTPEVVAVVETAGPSSEPTVEEPNIIEDAEEIPEATPTPPPARRDVRAEAKKADETRNRPSSGDDEDTDARPARARASKDGDDESEPGATRPRRAREAEPRDAPVDDQTNAEGDPGPRRIDRVRDIFTGSGQPRREERRRERLRRRGERPPEDAP